MVATVALLVLGTVACGVGPVGVTATKSAQGGGSTGGEGLFPTDTLDPASTDPAAPESTPSSTAPATDDVVDGVVDFGEAGPTHPEYDGFLTAAFGDIQEFWAETFPSVYDSPWKPLSGGIYAAYPDRTAPIPGCGGAASSTYEDVQQGTAFYCADGDFIAYDDAGDGLPALVELLGKEAVAIVLAHEFGHAIQQRAGEWDQPGVLKEQQADCFAGAWAARVATGASDRIRFDDAAVRAGLIAMIYVRDPLESDGLADPNAHGTGFDRVGAFKDGFEGGATRCKSFFTEDRLSQLIDVKWDPDDTSGGNLPIIDPNPDPKDGPDDIITDIPASLKLFWTDLAAANNVPFTPPTFEPFSTDGPYPTCAGIDPTTWPKSVQYCADDNVIHWDQDFATDLSTDPLTGDMSVGYLLSNAYSDAIQHALHRTAEGEPRALFSDCLTGAWVASIVPRVQDDRKDPLKLSAGDLDEAIVTAIARSDEHSDTDVNGSPFEKIGAFRTGVLGGLNACRDTTG
jgi:predicted metalloprotease